MPYRKLLFRHKERYPVLDVLRGVTFLSMLLYHACWDLAYLFRVDMPWYRTESAYVWQQSICWTFILLSGFCFSLGAKGLRRSIVVLLSGWLVSLVSEVFLPDSLIQFGVLTLIGSGMLLLVATEPWLRRVNPYAGAAVFFALFLFVRAVMQGQIDWLTVPSEWCVDLFTAYLGFPPESFWSTDYFPVFPWIFLYLTGYFLYRVFQQNNWLRIFRAFRCKPLEWVGKYCLYLYLVHQPVIYGVLTVWFLLVR